MEEVKLNRAKSLCRLSWIFFLLNIVFYIALDNITEHASFFLVGLYLFADFCNKVEIQGADYFKRSLTSFENSVFLACIVCKTTTTLIYAFSVKIMHNAEAKQEILSLVDMLSPFNILLSSWTHYIIASILSKGNAAVISIEKFD